MVPALDIPDLNVVSLLRDYGLSPKKGLGQNFLVNGEILKRIVLSADITPEIPVLEIGPGLGSLTRYLAQVSRDVTAIELDDNLMPVLRKVLKPYHNIRIVQGDILEIDPAELMEAEGYAVVANIPYSITSALIRHLLEASLKPALLVLTVQREVAERICAQPGKLSLLALSVQVYGKPRMMFNIPAGAFYPAPKVDSAVVRVDLSGSSAIPPEWMDDFFILTKAGFGQKRKMLRNALPGRTGLGTDRTEELLEAVGIDAKRRAETLTIEEWYLLTEQYINKFKRRASGHGT